MGPRIIIAQDNALRANPTPAVMGMALPFKAKLAPHVRYVNPGTPLVSDGQGAFDIDPSGDAAEWVAGTFGTGGDTVQAYRQVTLELYKQPVLEGFPAFSAGDRVRIADIDDHGVPHFARDHNGRFYAMTDTQVLMDCSRR